ncbi:MAG: hypothetical protein AB7U73_19680, partial [Pirellulales bacterium]
MQVVDAATDVAIDHRVRAFLQKLNAAGGPPMEEMSPPEARAVLVGLQASAGVELPPAKVSSLPIAF